MHLQCDVAQCQGICAEDVCPGDIITASAIKGTKPGNKEDGSTLAATTVFVLDPADAPCKWHPFRMNYYHHFINMLLFCWHFAVVSPVCDEGIRPAWLLWLCITLGILFLIMLLMNIFLCTAMSCSCARTEVINTFVSFQIVNAYF